MVIKIAVWALREAEWFGRYSMQIRIEIWDRGTEGHEDSGTEGHEDSRTERQKDTRTAGQRDRGTAGCCLHSREGTRPSLGTAAGPALASPPQVGQEGQHWPRSAPQRAPQGSGPRRCVVYKSVLYFGKCRSIHQ